MLLRVQKIKSIKNVHYDQIKYISICFELTKKIINLDKRKYNVPE